MADSGLSFRLVACRQASCWSSCNPLQKSKKADSQYKRTAESLTIHPMYDQQPTAGLDSMLHFIDSTKLAQDSTKQRVQSSSKQCKPSNMQWIQPSGMPWHVLMCSLQPLLSRSPAQSANWRKMLRHLRQVLSAVLIDMRLQARLASLNSHHCSGISWRHITTLKADRKAVPLTGCTEVDNQGR